MASASHAFDTSSSITGGSELYNLRPRCSIVVGSNSIVNLGRLLGLVTVAPKGQNTWVRAEAGILAWLLPESAEARLREVVSNEKITRSRQRADGLGGSVEQALRKSQRLGQAGLRSA